jgi:lipopolysaccharide assembly outer membrane protein LptD (OstA)
VRDFRSRAIPTARVDVMTRLRRRFADFVHVLEPRAGYALAYSSRSQDRNALFVPATATPLDRVRALDLDSVTRDEADRIARANRVTAGFDNRVYGVGEDGVTALLLDATLLGLYDAEGEAFDALILDGHAYPYDTFDAAFHVDFDPGAGLLDEALADLRWSHPSGVAFNAGYRWAREIPLFFEDFQDGDRFDSHTNVDHINQLRAGVSLDLTQRWSVSYALAYSLEGNQVLANRGLVEYLSRCGCWALGVEISQDTNRGVDAKLVYRLVGLSGDAPRPRQSLLDGL